MGFNTLIGIIAFLVMGTLITKQVTPSMVEQIKTTKVDTKVIQTEKAIFEAVCRYITLQGTNPTSLNDLITVGYFQATSNTNGFGGTYSFTIDSTKGTVTISTDISDATVRTSYINSYKNTFKPVQGSGNYVDTTFVLPTSVMHGNGQFMAGIPVQSTPPIASSYKFWYDTSGLQAVLRISDGTNWKTLGDTSSGGTSGGVSATSLGTINNGTSSLAYDANLKNGDIKYVWDSNAGQLIQYAYYSGGWYNLNSSSTSYSIVGTTCDDGNSLTTPDTVRSNGICKGSGVVMVADINVGSGSSSPWYLTVFNNKLYFQANTASNGTELWVYDGTNAPSLVADILAGSGSSNPAALAVFNNKLYFRANNGTTGNELWVYDGTNAPSMVADIYAGTSSSFPAVLTVFNNKLYFSAQTATTGNELWVYDGTNAPSMVADINAGLGSSNPNYLTVFNNKLYFQATTATNGQELWVYDGTNAPSMVADINAGTANSNPAVLTVFNNKLYFAASNGINGNELWVYDGTNAPSMVADIYAGASSSFPGSFTVFNNKLYFQATTAANGYELWVYDGTNAPSLVADIYTGAMASIPSGFTVLNNKLYFRAQTAANGTELWVYDGTNAPSLVADIYAGATGSGPTNLTMFNNKLYFQATTAANGIELWMFDE